MDCIKATQTEVNILNELILGIAGAMGKLKRNPLLRLYLCVYSMVIIFHFLKTRLL